MISLYRASIPADAVLAVGREADMSSTVASGPTVSAFERALVSKLGAGHCVVTADVSSALQLALRVVNRPRDGVVLASPLACLSTLSAVALEGFRIRWIDLDPDTLVLRTSEVRDWCGEPVTAVIAYHWAGRAGSYTPLLEASHSIGASLIEDASEAWGAVSDGRLVGAGTADVTAFSFYANKFVSSIDGGAITLSDSRIATEARRQRRFGIDYSTFRLPNGEINPESDIPRIGLSASLTSVAASWGLASLSEANALVEAHRQNARILEAAFAELPGIRLLRVPDGCQPSHWVYSMRVERADAFMAALRSRGVHSSRVHRRLDMYSAFASLGPVRDLPGVSLLSDQLVSVPCGWWLSTEEVDHVVAAVRAGW